MNWRFIILELWACNFPEKRPNMQIKLQISYNAYVSRIAIPNATKRSHLSSITLSEFFISFYCRWWLLHKCLRSAYTALIIIVIQFMLGIRNFFFRITIGMKSVERSSEWGTKKGQDKWIVNRSTCDGRHTLYGSSDTVSFLGILFSVLSLRCVLISATSRRFYALFMVVRWCAGHRCIHICNACFLFSLSYSLFYDQRQLRVV